MYMASHKVYPPLPVFLEKVSRLQYTSEVTSAELAAFGTHSDLKLLEVSPLYKTMATRASGKGLAEYVNTQLEFELKDGMSNEEQRQALQRVMEKSLRVKSFIDESLRTHSDIVDFTHGIAAKTFAVLHQVKQISASAATGLEPFFKTTAVRFVNTAALLGIALRP